MKAFSIKIFKAFTGDHTLDDLPDEVALLTLAARVVDIDRSKFRSVGDAHRWARELFRKKFESDIERSTIKEEDLERAQKLLFGLELFFTIKKREV